jgi:enoyl-CoA hydratase/carnithine racemase
MQGNAFTIEEDRSRPVATLRFARPDQSNRVSAAEIPSIAAAIRTLGMRKEFKLILIRADGDHFCLGRTPDRPGTAPTTALGIREGITAPILDVYAALREVPIPVMAVVQGDAKGFGCALVAACDLAIAADSAKFAFPEMDHHLPPTLAISAVLHKLTPKRILHMVYTRDAISAAEALASGLVSEMAPRAGLDRAVETTVGKLADRNRAALAGVKEYMGTALYADPNSAARMAANLLSTVLSSPKE